MRYKTIDYVVLSTVSSSDIFEAATHVQRQINSAVVGMSVALAICIAFVLVCVVFVAVAISAGIVEPINELKQLLASVARGDLSPDVAKEASSSDMILLLGAFSNLMIAMRFASDSFARGHKDRALQAFQEALQLYTLTGKLHCDGFRGYVMCTFYSKVCCCLVKK